MKKSKPQMSASCQQILDALIEVYPGKVSSKELQAKIGPAAKTRLNDLKTKFGWDIRCTIGKDSGWYYLETLQPGRATPVLVGVTITYDAGRDWASRTHVSAFDAGVVPPEELVRFEAETLARYRAMAEPYLQAKGLIAAPVPPVAPVVPAPTVDDALDLLASLRGDL